MVKHNNAIPNQHFHKKWARRVKTWLQQPIQKKIRRDRRKEKAAALAPRPASGNLRPLVHCPTQKYNSKVKLGRGFTLEELKGAGIGKKYAKTVGISVDHRRTNKSVESLKLNVARLAEYKSRLVVFPRKPSHFKKGDSTPAECNEATQLHGDIISKPAPAAAVTFAAITDEMKDFRAYAATRLARANARLVGIREKQAKAAKEKKDKEEN